MDLSPFSVQREGVHYKFSDSYLSTTAARIKATERRTLSDNWLETDLDLFETI